MRAWWQGLQARERRTLLLGAVALGAILYYFLLWQPPRTANEELRQRIAEQREDLRWLEAAAEEIRQLRGSANPGRADDGRALYALADETARDAGLGDAIERLEPTGGGSVRVSLTGAIFADLVDWLGALRQQHGIAAEQLSLRRSEPGRVDAQLELTGGG